MENEDWLKYRDERLRDRPASAQHAGSTLDTPNNRFERKIWQQQYDALPRRGDSRNRYANIELRDATGKWHLGLVPSNSIFMVRISIGALDPGSHVLTPKTFPDHLLPHGDTEISVVLASPQIWVANSIQDVDEQAHTCEATLTLPEHGGAAYTASGQSFLEFYARAPDGSALVRARVNYYFRGALLQSQKIEFRLDEPPISASTDYTASQTLSDIETIPPANRISVFLNDEPGGHTLVLRFDNGSRPSIHSTASLPSSVVGVTATEVRRAIAQSISGKERKSKRQLIENLRSLAPRGRELHRLLVNQAPEIFREMRQSGEPWTLSVCRPRGVTFTLPWQGLYTIGLTNPVNKVPICPLVTTWDERAALFLGTPDRCPYDTPEVPHVENLLCPFGFWAYGLHFEAPASAPSITDEIRISTAARVLIGRTTRNIDEGALSEHISALKELLSSSLPGLDPIVKTESTVEGIRREMSSDLPLIYFLCHGERPTPGGPEVALGFGNNQCFTAAQFTDWVEASWAPGKTPIWNMIRPFIFVNACEALEVSPSTLTSYVDAFVGGAKAVGVLGAEVRVPQSLAMAYGAGVLSGLLGRHETISQAVRRTNLEFLAGGSLFGLAYSTAAWGHLRISTVATTTNPGSAA